MPLKKIRAHNTALQHSVTTRKSHSTDNSLLHKQWSQSDTIFLFNYSNKLL